MLDDSSLTINRTKDPSQVNPADTIASKGFSSQNKHSIGADHVLVVDRTILDHRTHISQPFFSEGLEKQQRFSCENETAARESIPFTTNN